MAMIEVGRLLDMLASLPRDATLSLANTIKVFQENGAVHLATARVADGYVQYQYADGATDPGVRVAGDEPPPAPDEDG